MKSDIYIPKTIRVGYDERSDTYTGKLAYVIYIDSNGTVRKKASWETWRDKNIEPNDYSNEPTSGFVLNKKAGGYSTGWNHRQTYARIYDPRGFEFEITIPNLLYILENTNSIKGKGLEGDFVYGWSGKDLVLLPTSAPDYKDLMEFTKATHKKESITGKNIIIGGTYRTNKNDNWIYLGRFDEYSTHWGETSQNSKGKKYWFLDESGKIETLQTLSKKIIQTVDSTPISNYAEIMDVVETMERFSPRDKDKEVVKKLSLDGLKVLCNIKGTYYSHTPEVLLTIDGILLEGTVCNNRSYTEDKENRYYVSHLRRVKEVELERFSPNSYASSVFRGYNEYAYYSNKHGGYVIDKELGDIHKKYDKYFRPDTPHTLEELEDTFNFYMCFPYLKNGKPMRLDSRNRLYNTNTYSVLSIAQGEHYTGDSKELVEFMEKNYGEEK